MSAPSWRTAAVGTGTSAIASMNRCPSRSGLGNTPATDSAASRASHSGPCRCATGTRSVRSTAMITSGIAVCEKNACRVACLSRPVSVSTPADPTSGEENSFPTFSALNASRKRASTSAAPQPSATCEATNPPMLEPPT